MITLGITMPKIYRFSILDSEKDISKDDLENSLKQIKIIRYSLDETPSKKSISILADDTQDDLAIRNQLIAARILFEDFDEEVEIISYSDDIPDETLPAEKKIKTISLTRKKKVKNHGHNHFWKGMIGSIWGIGLFVISILSLNIPMVALYCITAASALMTIYLGHETFVSAAKSVFESKKLSTDTLYTISALTVIGVSIASFFFPWLPLMFEGGPLILGFMHIGEAVEHSLTNKVDSGLRMTDSAPKTVELIAKDDDSKQNISVNKLIPNDIIKVRKGEVIPVDGACLDESTLLYTSKITGSPFPQVFKRGDAILAGMRVPDDVDYIQMRVTRTFQRSYLARIDANIQQANNEKAPIEVFTNKILHYFIPGLLILALISAITIGILFNPALAIQCALSVLVSACPCALGLVTPFAVKIGMTKAAENGVNFKNGKALQAAEKIDTVVFDLNGTLTTGTPKVSDYKILSKKYSSKEFLECLAVLESKSEHPVAKAILRFANKQDLSDVEPTIFDHIDKSDHSGIIATKNGETFILGNEIMMAKHGIKLNSMDDKSSDSLIYLARGQEIIGYISINDSLRSDAKRTVDELQRLGKTVHICTGADQKTAIKYAQQLGISTQNVMSGCVGTMTKPGDITKMSYIDRLHREGHKISMIGDAANDAIAITKSDFGIAIKSNAGDEITQQQAGAVVQNESLMPIVTAFEVARQTKRNIIQNLMISLTYNTTITLIAGGLLLAVGFALNPGIGIALMILETTLVLLNAYRFKHQNLAHIKSEIVNSTQEKSEQPTTYRKLKELGLNQNELSPSPKPLMDEKESRNVLKISSYRQGPPFYASSKIFDGEEELELKARGTSCCPVR